MKAGTSSKVISNVAQGTCPCGGYAAPGADASAVSIASKNQASTDAVASPRRPSPAKAARSKSAIPYRDCCGRFIDDGQRPANAEQLMRSRYTAYVLERFDYLRETWDPATCPADLGNDPAAQWLGLEVRAHREDDAQTASVEFVARYKINGRAHRLHELSRFRRADDGRWRYVDGNVSDS